MNQGEDLVKVTVRVRRGARVSSTESKIVLYWLTKLAGKGDCRFRVDSDAENTLFRSEMLSFLTLRKDIVRCLTVLDVGIEMLKTKNLWSDMERSNALRLKGVSPEQQIKSSVCPLLWVGKSTNCTMSKLSKVEIKSLQSESVGLSI